MELSLFILVLLIASILSVILSFYVWRKRLLLNISSLAGLLFSIAIWCFASAFELTVTSIEAKRIFTIFCYVGITTIPVWFFLFSLEFTGNFSKVNRVVRYSLWVMPVVSLTMLISNPFHGFFYEQSILDFVGNIPYQRVVPGLWWWFHLAYSYLLIFIGIVLFFQMWNVSSTQQRSVINLILASCVIPMVANMFYVSGFRPLTFIDITPVAFAASGMLFFWGIYSKNLFSVKPIALNTLFDNMPDGIIVVDKATRIVDVNPAAIRILRLGSFFPEGELANDVLPFVIDFGRTIDFVMPREYAVKDRSVEVIVSEINATEGHKGGHLLVVRDISDRKRAEEELQTTRDRFDLAIMAAGFDPWENNFITGERKGGVKMFLDLGYSFKEIPSKIDGIYELVHPDDIERVKQTINKHFSGLTDVYINEFRIKDKKGNYQWVTNYGRLVERDSDGKPLRFIGLTLNIDEQKKAEERIKKKNEQLIKANAEKDKFFSIIAHDLKGPFQGFIGLTELIADGSRDISVQEMKEINYSLNLTAKNLYELLENLLSWAQVKRGNKHFNAERVRVFGLIESISEIVDSQIRVKEQVIINSVEEGLDVLADKESLKTILRNLISNAVKFTPKKGTITVSSNRASKGMVEISVNDTGIGMSSSIKEGLFVLTRKVSRLGTEKEPSTGLGLILCKELVEKHGGNIWATSEEGEGSTLTFTMPLAG